MTPQPPRDRTRQRGTADLGAALTPSEEALHRNLRSAVGQLQRDLVRVCYYLLQIRERHIHRKLGFATMADYAEAAAGLTARQTEDFIALARRLRRYPDVEKALASGRLTWTQARLITARAEPHEQRHWIAQAGRLSMRQLEAALPPRQSAMPLPGATRGDAADGLQSHPGEGPGSPPQATRPPAPGRQGSSPDGPRPGDRQAPQEPQAPPQQPAPTWHYWNIKWTVEQYAAAGSLLAHLQAATGRSVPEIVLDALACRSGPARCAAERDTPRSRSAGPPFLLVLLACPECGRVSVPTPRGELAVDDALLRRARCDSLVEAADGSRRPVVPARLRRRVMQRARYACEAPGCTHASFLEIHHRIPFAVGGGNDPANLLVLCARCHHDLHERDGSAARALSSAPA